MKKKMMKKKKKKSDRRLSLRCLMRHRSGKKSNKYVLIDVKFASGITNIHFVFFTLIHQCVLALYSQYLPYTGFGKVLSIQCCVYG